jgi:hypothetical protein
MEKYKRKPEKKLVFMEEKMEDVKRRVASGVSQQRVAKSHGTNTCTLRK